MSGNGPGFEHMKIGEGLIKAVRLERERNPRAKAAVIARRLGKSREAIRQVLMELGLPTSFDAVAFCTTCGDKLASGNVTGRHRECFVAPEVKDAVVRDYLRGDKPAAIWLAYNIKRGVMYRILHSRNVKLRSRV